MLEGISNKFFRLNVNEPKAEFNCTNFCCFLVHCEVLCLRYGNTVIEISFYIFLFLFGVFDLDWRKNRICQREKLKSDCAKEKWHDYITSERKA